MPRIRRLGVFGRAALAIASACGIIALAACGSHVAAGQSSSGGQPPSADGSSASRAASADSQAEPGGPIGSTSARAALCADIPHLTSVTVSLTSGFRDSQLGSVLPRGITIVEPALVRGLAAALCGLPEIPRIALTCPAQFGTGSLRFGFAAGARAFPPVVVQVSGCRVVTGLGPVRRASSAAFWRTVDEDLGGLASQPSPNASGGVMP